MNCEADYQDDYYDDVEEVPSCSCTIMDEDTYDGCPCCTGFVQNGNMDRKICGAASWPLSRLTALAGQQKQTLESGLYGLREKNSRICGPRQCWVRGKCCDLISTRTGHRCPIHC